MAYLKCLGSALSSGSITRDVLWEYTGSYSSNFPGTQDIELSGNIGDYDYIEFLTISNQNSEMQERTYAFTSDDIQASVGDDSTLVAIVAVGSYGSRHRTVKYVSETELTIAYLNSTQATKYCIPSKITGVKL